MQEIVTEIWNNENKRVIKRYYRHTNKEKRNIVRSLLDKKDKFHRIVTINQDMKNFSNTALNDEIEKYLQLEPVFEIAKILIPKLRLSTTTINYYASLINYYNGYRLTQLNDDQAQLYLLCYAFSRYQTVNDNLLETLKKRTLEYHSEATQYAKDEAAKQLEVTKHARAQASELLVAIHDYQGKNIPKTEIHKYIPNDALLMISQLGVSNKNNQITKKYPFYTDFNMLIESATLAISICAGCSPSNV